MHPVTDRLPAVRSIEQLAWWVLFDLVTDSDNGCTKSKAHSTCGIFCSTAANAVGETQIPCIWKWAGAANPEKGLHVFGVLTIEITDKFGFLVTQNEILAPARGHFDWTNPAAQPATHPHDGG